MFLPKVKIPDFFSFLSMMPCHGIFSTPSEFEVWLSFDTSMSLGDYPFSQYAQPWCFFQHPAGLNSQPNLTKSTSSGDYSPPIGRTRCSFNVSLNFSKFNFRVSYLCNLNYMLNFEFIWNLNLMCSKLELCIPWICLVAHWVKGLELWLHIRGYIYSLMPWNKQIGPFCFCLSIDLVGVGFNVDSDVPNFNFCICDCGVDLVSCIPIAFQSVFSSWYSIAWTSIETE